MANRVGGELERQICMHKSGKMLAIASGIALAMATRNAVTSLQMIFSVVSQSCFLVLGSSVCMLVYDLGESVDDFERYADG